MNINILKYTEEDLQNEINIWLTFWISTAVIFLVLWVIINFGNKDKK